MHISRPSMAVIMGLTGLLLISVPASRAEESKDKGAIVEGAGFTLFDMESIKGFDEKENRARPDLRPVEASQNSQS